MPPVAPRSFAVMGFPSRVTPTKIGVKALAQVFAVASQRDDGHDFRSGGDDESGAAGAAVSFAVEGNGDAAQCAIVHVHGAGPGDALGVEIQGVAVEEMRVERQRADCAPRDGVKIAGEMEVDVLVRLQAREAAAGGAAFHAENGTERRLSRSDDYFFPERGEALRESDGGDRFTLAGSGGRGGGDENHFAAALEIGIGEKLESHLCGVAAKLFEILLGNAKFGGDLLDGEE